MYRSLAVSRYVLGREWITLAAQWAPPITKASLVKPSGSFYVTRTFCSSTIGKKVILPLEPCVSDDVKSNEISSGIKFSDIEGLKPELVRRLDKLGFASAFEIQAQTLPHTLAGRDLIGRAVTGSGKTLAFAIPIINKLMSSSKRYSNPRAIAIAPTRELCRQLMKHVSVLSSEYRCVALYGGDSISRQERELDRGADVICATPGRLNDHIQRGNFRLDDVQFIILDEADELLNPNFREQIEDVLCSTPNKQMMLFSATMPGNIRQLIKEHMTDPVTVDLTKNSMLIPSTITHQAMLLKPYIRDKVVVQLLKTRDPSRAIVFTPTKAQASSLARFIARHGVSATALHSDLSQHIRDSCLQDFRDGHFKVIVATDVAARGIDIPDLELVIHCDPPPNGVNYYIHRSGRTGRKGNIGTSILLLSDSQDSGDFLFHIKKTVNLEIINPPTYAEVAKIAIDNAVKSVEELDPKLSDMTLKSAEKLYETRGIKALSAALAIVAHLKVDEPNHIERYNRRGGENRYNGGRRRYDGTRGGSSWGGSSSRGYKGAGFKGGFRKPRDDYQGDYKKPRNNFFD